MTIYLVKQEQGLPLLRQAALSMASTLQLDILSLDPALYSTDETMQVLCSAIRSAFSPVVVETLVNGDTVIFEIPPYITDQVVWTGIALYKRAINSTLDAQDKSQNEQIHVLSVACLPWS